MSTSILKKTLLEAPIIKKGKYDYVIHPITDGIPQINPDLLKEVTDEISNQIQKYLPIDKIVTIEAMGIPIASALSLKLNIPFTVIRKRKYGLSNEKTVKQETGYSKSELHINGLDNGDEIVIVDDVLSTGGTLKAVLKTLLNMNVNVKAVFIAVDKGDKTKILTDKTGIPITSLVKIDVINGKIMFLD